MSTRQEHAIQLLLEGRRDAEVARVVGVRPSLLRAWKQNPRFRRAWALASRGLAKSSLALLAASVFDQGRRRRPEPEVPWTTHKENDDE